MSVVIETTIGDVTVDLFLTERPRATLNFLKLCKLKYYNFNLFHTIQHGFISQTGDPGGSGDGGSSIWGVIEGKHKRYFEGETVPKIRHTEPGLLSMVCAGEGLIGSQFFFTLGADLSSLDAGGHVVIGEVAEGHEVLRKLNEVICDEKNRPYKDVRITHTVVLDDPFEDPRGFREPSRSPSPSAERLAGGRIAADEDIDDTEGKTMEEIAEQLAEKEAKARATILEIVGDIPDADMAPPENVLFVCKLNPVTTDDDLQIIFSRFGKIKGCEVIRDKVSGDSLQYAFIEFEDKKSCEGAYFKMDNVLIDDRRIHVDFSQSVSKMRWRGKGKGIVYMDGADEKEPVKESRSKDSQKDRKRAPSRSKDRRRLEPSKSRSRSPSYRRRDRSPRQRPRDDGRSQRKSSPRSSQHRDLRVKLSESNTAHFEDRNGREIRVVEGMVDYKNRPYPSTYIKRNITPAARGGRPGGNSDSRNRSRSPVRARPHHRSRSRDRRRVSRSRSRSTGHRKRSDSRDRYERRRASPEKNRPIRRSSYSRSPERKRRHSRSLERSHRGVPSRRSPTPQKTRPLQSHHRKASPTPERKKADKHKKSKKKHHSSSDSESDSDSSGDDRRSKKKSKKKSSGKKKSRKSKKYSSDDGSSSSSSSDSDSSADARRKKKKNKTKRRK
ncbi:peptidyl-prolyl cis-trans isomerase sig-7 [Uranotaenia lowii]|uniref:peptidyl-prolyl cis-trans isomerase sig-7 n=1 Tax=Uranotaenia lowii TaxID=190385 RepID=UPI00247979D7|nr:peptidyl-prolyl cis-trans isomerase sig-7 [Uranotaenia lowii]